MSILQQLIITLIMQICWYMLLYFMRMCSFSC
jgi:hypothetical protein